MPTYDKHFNILQQEKICTATAFLLHYFFMATFFWMFVEGLYLLAKIRPELCHRAVHIAFWIALGWGKLILGYEVVNTAFLYSFA